MFLLKEKETIAQNVKFLCNDAHVKNRQQTKLISSLNGTTALIVPTFNTTMNLSHPTGKKRSTTTTVFKCSFLTISLSTGTTQNK